VISNIWYPLSSYFHLPNIPTPEALGLKQKQNEKANQKTKPQQEDDFKSEHIRDEQPGGRWPDQWKLRAHKGLYL